MFSSNFPSNLKAADFLTIQKKNYRPISILPTLSKIYEGCMCDQMYKYFDQILSKYQWGLRWDFNTQHCLLVIVEKMKEVLDKGCLGGALLTDLSKAFDCIKHDLLIAILAAYGFDSHSFLQSNSMQSSATVNIRSSSFQYKHMRHVFWKIRLGYCQLRCW